MKLFTYFALNALLGILLSEGGVAVTRRPVLFCAIFAVVICLCLLSREIQ